MRLAIWGMGRQGRAMLGLLLLYPTADYEVACCFDQNIHALNVDSFSDGIAFYSPERIEELYHRNRFDSVVIGAYKEDIRQLMAQQLNTWGIPILEWSTIGEEMIVPVDHICENDAPFLPYLLDSESLDIIEARNHANNSNDEEPFMRVLAAYANQRAYWMSDLYNPMKRCDAKRVILFGGGQDGALNLNALVLCGTPVAACCSLFHGNWDWSWPNAVKVIPPEEIFESEYADCIVVISTHEDHDEVVDWLNDRRFPEERIVDPWNGYRSVLIGFRPGQYFDVWKPRDDEVFVDCGAYDGQTLQEFNKWCSESYEAIHALEPLPDMQDNLRRNTLEMHDVAIHSVAAWERDEMLSFSLDGAGSCVSSLDSAAIDVQGASLDNLISGRVSFIKMDIEGSELAAINGAQHLIQKWKPRLAISIYHKKKDLFSIPMRILELVPEYRFRIRHYSAGLYETILYATVNPDDWLRPEGEQ